MGHIAQIVTAPFVLSRLYAEGVTKGIKAENFARKPEGIDLNHPAFNFGHLAVYPDRILEMLGRSDLARPDQKYIDWFSAGKPCLDDPGCKVYPGMEEIMVRFYERYDTVVEVVRACDDDVLLQPNPSQSERMRTFFPSLGMMLSFLLDGHCQTHIGQVSAWRRCMGLPSAF